MNGNTFNNSTTNIQVVYQKLDIDFDKLTFVTEWKMVFGRTL